MSGYVLTKEQKQFKDNIEQVLTDNWDMGEDLIPRDYYVYVVELQHFLRKTYNSSKDYGYIVNKDELQDLFIEYAVTLLHCLGVSKSAFVDILVSKNVNYGNSFDQVVNMYGMVGMFIRFEDKINRLHQLHDNGVDDLVGEAIEDTLLDIAGYAMLSVNYLKSYKLD